MTQMKENGTLPVPQEPCIDAPPGGRILIVDDEPLNREVVQLMLAEDGCVLSNAASGEEALAMIAREPPDLVLLDVMLPGMDGYAVAIAIKCNPATKNIPIIMLTALGDQKARMLGLDAGAEEFLTKPMDRAELRVRVRNLLRLKAAYEELDLRSMEIAAALEEAREARMMAEHANMAKTMFLRAMSHELRTPLNAISGFTELLELGIRGPVNADQIKDLGRIKRASTYLLRLINDVLTVSRLEGAAPLDLRSVAVTPVLDEVEGLCMVQAKDKGLNLTVTSCTPELFVTADLGRLQQILLNLITNAIKFTNKGGSISVTAQCEASMVRIYVKDTGIGVRSADLDRVFEPFVQVDRHLTQATQQGVGLGLSISRDLARAMGGDLTLESVEGAGSTFVLVLPVTTKESPTAPPTESPVHVHARRLSQPSVSRIARTALPADD